MIIRTKQFHQFSNIDSFLISPRLHRLDMAHTVTCEEEMSKQQRALVLESVGWIVTVSDLLDAAKRVHLSLINLVE